MKICTKCKKIKEEKDFSRCKKHRDGFSYWCKVCVSRLAEEYYEKNKESISKHTKEYYEKNRDCLIEKKKIWHTKNKDKMQKLNKQYYEKNKVICLKQKRKYYIENKDEINKQRNKYFIEYRKTHKKQAKQYRDENKEQIKEHSSQYYSENKSEIIKQHNNYKRQKRRDDPRFRLNANMGRAIWHALKTGKNNRHWELLVNFTLSDLIEKLEKQFKKGMSWSNYGDWHVDHIIPKSYFIFKSSEDEEFKKCWSLKNLQPLWAEENFKKNNHYCSIQV